MKLSKNESGTQVVSQIVMGIQGLDEGEAQIHGNECRVLENTKVNSAYNSDTQVSNSKASELSCRYVQGLGVRNGDEPIESRSERVGESGVKLDEG
ncbi:OLC1v1039126C1 [Oldenlandia corymbosa var. corymbosa]|uniref:OLC1v1039126C1 n=2 Tax=Oldenlandia corymbosa var. corymbosa TaxID=529605 RepID=A0AAV1D4G4_OLDCO|nr:OLC1v1039126C1 [Oldenlandia corymbosa var. corymbosa]